MTRAVEIRGTFDIDPRMEAHGTFESYSLTLNSSVGFEEIKRITELHIGAEPYPENRECGKPDKRLIGPLDPTLCWAMNLLDLLASPKMTRGESGEMLLGFHLFLP